MNTTNRMTSTDLVAALWLTAQEAEDQRNLNASPILPKKVTGGKWEELEAAGVRRLSDQDDLFVYVELPPGWQKKATGHSMWSDLLDEAGRKRASIYFKAASYNRDAHMIICRRFSVEKVYANDYRTCKVEVRDGDAVLYSTDEIVRPREIASKKEQWLYKMASDWLDKHLPRWKDASAYWGEEINIQASASESQGWLRRLASRVGF